MHCQQKHHSMAGIFLGTPPQRGYWRCSDGGEEFSPTGWLDKPPVQSYFAAGQCICTSHSWTCRTGAYTDRSYFIGSVVLNSGPDLAQPVRYGQPCRKEHPQLTSTDSGLVLSCPEHCGYAVRLTGQWSSWCNGRSYWASCVKSSCP